MKLKFWQRQQAPEPAPEPAQEHGDWVIRCGPGNPDWTCRLADCSRTHAERVFADLQAEPTCPEDLTLHEETHG